MFDEIPKGDLAVYVFLEMIALGFALASVDSLVAGKPWWVYTSSLAAAIGFFLVGIRGPYLKTSLAKRLPWVRLKKELQSALNQIEELKKNQRPTFWEAVIEPPQLTAGGPTLKIHAAMWGTGPRNDRRVADILQRRANGTLDVVINNDLFGQPDPAFGKAKRCEVEYSLGDGAHIKTTRWEGARLHLPEDSYLLEQIDALQARILPPSNPTVWPDLKVEYRESLRGQRAALIFRVRKGSPVTIQKVGPLVSEEVYRTESNFVLLQSVIPEVEIDHPVESQLSFVRNEKSGDLVALEDVLEAGGPGVTDSVLIECTAEGQHFSRRYYLHKNADGSIVWSPEPRQAEPKDLRGLRHTLRSLRDAIDNLTLVGRLNALEEDSLALESQLSEILDSTPNEEIDRDHPLKRENISLDPSETLLPSLGRLRLMSFRDRYNHFGNTCRGLWLHRSTAVPNLPNLPNSLTRAEVLEAISLHRAGINSIRLSLTRQYVESFGQGAH